jgi:DNA mismatch endonuclease (patch repair protein)
MVDIVSPDKRSALMSRIRNKDTLPEMRVRKGLWQSGLRYRLHVRELPGRPDLVLPRWNACVFVHGCFWHHHDGCQNFRLPRTRPRFWKDKLVGNKRRDIESIAALDAAGWRVAVVWECAVRADCDRIISMLARWIRSGKRSMEITGSGKGLGSDPLVQNRR